MTRPRRWRPNGPGNGWPQPLTSSQAVARWRCPVSSRRATRSALDLPIRAAKVGRMLRVNGSDRAFIWNTRAGGAPGPDGLDAVGPGGVVLGDHLLVVRVTLDRQEGGPGERPPHLALEPEDLLVGEDATREQCHRAERDQTAGPARAAPRSSARSATRGGTRSAAVHGVQVGDALGREPAAPPAMASGDDFAFACASSSSVAGRS